MRKKRTWFGVIIVAAVCLCMGCNQPQDNTPWLTTVTIAAIEGVEPPAAGGVPVTVITPTSQYTGTVAWNPDHAVFAASTVYTAAITLKPTAGYTLDRVRADYFRAAGAQSVKNAAGSGVVTAVFPAVSLPVITIERQPAETTTVIEGSITSSLSVQVSVTEGAVPSYQWYSNTNNSTAGGTAIDGQTNARFTVPATLTADGATAKIYYYFCEVRAAGGSVSQRSSAAAVKVNPPPVITITKEPESITIASGIIEKSFLTVTAEVSQETTLRYQWYSNTINSTTGGTKLDGQTNASFVFPITGMPSTDYYFCEVGAAGARSAYSNVAAVIYGTGAEIVMRLTAITEADVIAQTAYARSGTDTPFTVNGTDYTAYQWYLDGSPAGTSPAYTFNQTAGAYELAVAVTDTAGRKYSGSCRVTVR